MIAVTAWKIDGGAFQLHHCKADACLITATAGATLDASRFVVSNASAAGMLVSSGEVTMRASVNQGRVLQIVLNVVLTRRLPFLHVCPCWAIAFLPLRYWRIQSDKFATTQAPRPEHCYSNSARLQRKETTQISLDSSCLCNMLTPKEAGTSQRYCRNIHEHFGFSFPSRAKVVKVTHLNVTGSEASISWSSEVPWHFKQRNVRSRSTMIHLRFPRLSKCQESTVHDMDCDDSFGGYNRSDGVGCTKCDPGSVFVKNITEKTIANRSAVQHCVPCPNGTSICNATFIEMLPGCLGKKELWSKRTLYIFVPFFCLNLMPM